MSPGLQAALVLIQCEAEERLEVIRDKQRQLQMTEPVEMKPVVGHVEVVKKDEDDDTELADTGPGAESEPKCRVTQSVAALKDMKRKEHMALQEQRWQELMQGHKDTGASASASVGTSVTATTSTSAGGEAELALDLEEAMLSQGDEEGDAYRKKYKTMKEDRTDRSEACAKQKEEREQQETERKAMEYAQKQLQKQIEEHRNRSQRKRCWNKRSRKCWTDVRK